MSQRDVADLLHIGSGFAVCNQLNALREKGFKDRRVCKQIKQTERRLDALHTERCKGAKFIQKG